MFSNDFSRSLLDLSPRLRSKIFSNETSLFYSFNEMRDLFFQNRHFSENNTEPIQSCFSGKVDQTDEQEHKKPRKSGRKKYSLKIALDALQTNSVRVYTKDDKLVVVISEINKLAENDDYALREFRKSFQLPANAQGDKLKRFKASDGRLVIEIPIKLNTEPEDISEDSYEEGSEKQNNGFFDSMSYIYSF